MVEPVKHNQSEEDYLESILLLSQELDYVHRIDVARRINVSQAAVNKAVKILIDKGYVVEDGKHLILTASGTGKATQVLFRHKILCRFLEKLGVSKQTAESDACRLEHEISDETFEKITEFLQD